MNGLPGSRPNNNGNSQHQDTDSRFTTTTTLNHRNAEITVTDPKKTLFLFVLSFFFLSLQPSVFPMRHHRLQATQCNGAHSTFDLLFKQSGRSFLLSVLQSVPRLENKPLFVLRPPPSLLSYTPPQLQQGRAGGWRGAVCVTALFSLVLWLLKILTSHSATQR